MDPITIKFPSLTLGRMDSLQAELILSGLLGMIAPWITAFFNKRKYSDQKRVTISIVVSAILGLTLAFITGSLDNLSSILVMVGVIWNTSQVVYRNVARNFGIRQYENATTPPADLVEEPEIIDKIEEIDHSLNKVIGIVNATSNLLNMTPIGVVPGVVPSFNEDTGTMRDPASSKTPETTMEMFRAGRLYTEEELQRILKFAITNLPEKENNHG